MDWVADFVTGPVTNWVVALLRLVGLSGTWIESLLVEGIAPVIGGVLNDRVAPVAIWYGGLLMGLTAATGLMLLERRLKPQEAV
jgi:hypothetical protein